MNRSDVKEFHYIARFENVVSILRRGILCRHRATRWRPVDIADNDVLDRRKTKRVPGGHRLFDYANVYFDARNAMLFRRLEQTDEIAIVRVSKATLDIKGAVIADRNAAAGTARFYPVAQGLAALDCDAVFAKRWNDDGDAKQRRMAELLVPRSIPSELLLGCYVRDLACADRLVEREVAHDVTVNSYIFFQEAR